MSTMAIEVGETFTDVIWIDDEDQVRTHKLPSTPHDPSIGVIAGVNATLGDRVYSLSQSFHGSTVATNTILERKGCRAAFLTTCGFRDVLMLQRQLRPNVYAVACRKPEPLIPLLRAPDVRFPQLLRSRRHDPRRFSPTRAPANTVARRGMGRLLSCGDYSPRALRAEQ